MRSTVAGFLLCALLVNSGVRADDDGSEVAETQKRVTTSQSLKALGTDLFGESTNFYDGKTTFSATDIDLPGNNALPVKLTRTFVAEDAQGTVQMPSIAGWQLEVPYVYSVYPTGYSWKGTGSNPYNRCTGMGNAPVVSGFTAASWSRGNFLHVPGMGNQSMASALTSFQATDGQTTVSVTSKYWQVRCGVQLANAGIEDFAGEGFVILSPDGTKYTFNWMAAAYVDPVKRATPPQHPGQPNGSISLPRKEVRIFATRIEDRFGNYVNYSYSGNRLTQISASDGRTINLSYNGDNATATAAGKTWQYASGQSFIVTLPDGTSWQYTFSGSFHIEYGTPPQYLAATCNRPASWNPSTQTSGLHIVHPSGAVGDFTFLLTRHGRTNVDNACEEHDVESPYTNKLYGAPEFTDNFALSSKQVSGPGLTTATWSVAYDAPAGSVMNDGGGGAETTSVSVTNPDTSKTRYTFGIHWMYNEGKLLRTETLAPNGSLLRDVQTAYALSPNNPPYVFDLATSGRDNFAERFVTPRTQTTITQDGTTYTNTVNSFDNMARELSVTRSNSTGAARTDSAAFYDNTSKWVLGRIASSTNSDTGTVVSSTTYDPATALPVATYSFGLLQKTIGYKPDGTVDHITNPLNQTISFANWKRGAPQLITFPDTKTRSAVVNDDGTVASTTDELSSTTSYGYDGAGRLTSLAWPTGDTVNWAPKNVGYTVLTASELGIPAGSWRLRLTEGAHQKSTYYDAKLNPILEEEKDLNSGQVIYTRRTYDVMGRVNFEAYPSTSASNNVGTKTDYDYLGRATRKYTSANITLGTTAYLSGNRLQVTDAKGAVTTTSYQAWDKPAYDNPVVIAAPENQTTSYNRGYFGQVLSATRWGANGESLTETNIYDNHNRLCKVLRPESGPHIVKLDDANRVEWTSTGVGSTANNCDYDIVPESEKIKYGYDARGRKVLIDYADSSGDVTMAYDDAGRLTSVTNPTATWNYTWNKRGLMESEYLAVDVRGYGLWYRYDSLGNLSQRTYADSLAIAYSPDAWGRPTRMDGSCCNGITIGAYASDIQYFPNGVVSSYDLGSGNHYTATLDARQRLQSQTVSNPGTLQSLTYSYDDNNQLTQITDYVDGSDTASYGYDGLHRLTSANGLWGSYGYGYDAIGNLKTRAGTNALNYGYDINSNRLSTVTGGASRGYSYDTKGRVTGDGRFGYSWNQADQIVSEPGAATFSYDGYGKRVKATKADGTVEYTMYDHTGAMVFADIPAIGQHWAYLHIDGRTAIKVVNGTPTYLYSDKLGSPRLATTNTGAIAWREHYEPYGKKMNGVADKVGYTGHAYDPETALTYMQARYYDAEVGRFLMTDPIGSKDDLNLYAYVGGNPTNATDPTGISAFYGEEGGPNLSSRVGGMGSSGDYAGNGTGFGADAANNASISNSSNNPANQPKPQNQTQTAQPATPSGNQYPSDQSATRPQPMGPFEPPDTLKDPSVNYKQGVPFAQGPLKDVLGCIAACVDHDITVTSTSERVPQHPATTPHGRGLAADIRANYDSPQDLLRCASDCGARFGLNEVAHPSALSTAPHVHIQIIPGTRGGSGDLPE